MVTQRAASSVTTGVMSCFTLPPNGVVNRAMHYGNSPPQIALSSTIDLHSGNVGSSDTPQQPENLQVTATTANAEKSSREDGVVVDGGSVPCTPELHVSSSPAGDEVLDSFTRLLISQFLRDYVAGSDPRWNESKELSTLKRVVHGLVEKHRYLYNGKLNELSLDNGVNVAFVSDIAVTMFGDGRTNWGRIGSLLAFGAVLCRRLKETGRGDYVELVGQEICSYLLTVQRDWIVRNNSWEGFVKCFLVADPERSLRNALIGLLGFAGVGMAVALWIR